MFLAVYVGVIWEGPSIGSRKAVTPPLPTFSVLTVEALGEEAVPGALVLPCLVPPATPRLPRRQGDSRGPSGRGSLWTGTQIDGSVTDNHQNP